MLNRTLLLIKYDQSAMQYLLEYPYISIFFKKQCKKNWLEEFLEDMAVRTIEGLHALYQLLLLHRSFLAS